MPSPSNLLQEEITFTLQGQTVTMPLLAALEALDDEGDADDQAAFVETLGLERCLQAFSAIWLAEPPPPFADSAAMVLVSDIDMLLTNLQGEGRTVLPELADHFAQQMAAGEYVDDQWRWVIFVGLVRAGVPIRPAWDRLLPLGFGVKAPFMLECMEAIPESRREAAVLAALGNVRFNFRPIASFLLESYPSTALATMMLEHSDRGDGSRKKLVDAVRRCAEDHPDIAEVLAQHLSGTPPAVTLTRGPERQPDIAENLSVIERAQLRKAGTLWDGKDLSAEDRLDPSEENEEVSFYGFLRGYTLHAADGAPTYDAWRYYDAGVVFRTGTTDVVAEIIQDHLHCDEASLKRSLSDILM